MANRTKVEGVELGRTYSVCPVCLERLEARKIAYGESIYLEKECSEHGPFKTLIWDGPPAYADWARECAPPRPDACASPVDKGCPFDCGLCADHLQKSCCTLIEVTQRCDLGCPFCFASAGEDPKDDPSLGTVRGWLQTLLDSGGPYNLPISGGEPTVRDDLCSIISMAGEMGFVFTQLNTNGLRIAREDYYAKKLRQAGLDCVYLQFDAVRDEPYEVLRGRPLWREKQEAVLRCAEAGLGVVLVPTVVPGVNDGEVGGILRYAFDHLPAVRGVHFQPVSYFGRYPGMPDAPRHMTLPALLRAIESQTDGGLRAEHFHPSGAQNSYCGFNASFLLLESGEIRPMGAGGGCDCSADSARKVRDYVARRWSPPKAEEGCQCACGSVDTGALDAFLRRVQTHSLAVSCMMFQDAWNLETDRLRQCRLHVAVPDGRLVPFCAYNLTATNGRTLYRPREGRGDD